MFMKRMPMIAPATLAVALVALLASIFTGPVASAAGYPTSRTCTNISHAASGAGNVGKFVAIRTLVTQRTDACKTSADKNDAGVKCPTDNTYFDPGATCEITMTATARRSPSVLGLICLFKRNSACPDQPNLTVTPEYLADGSWAGVDGFDPDPDHTRNGSNDFYSCSAGPAYAPMSPGCTPTSADAVSFSHTVTFGAFDQADGGGVVPNERANRQYRATCATSTDIVRPVDLDCSVTARLIHST